MTGLVAVSQSLKSISSAESHLFDQIHGDQRESTVVGESKKSQKFRLIKHSTDLGYRISLIRFGKRDVTVFKPILEIQRQ